ncbi:phosphatase PAP2 family protein [Ignavibacteria bacterium CHB1]|nr:MAG: phosphatase PAP2 family protein [Chlorobiota bacterium]MBV6398107.1 hypothetical protein [Ignavibacteria bacterium]MCC6886556.1 phosphatase PAP2 family protein [Ignavibacteriales bacterium]MCE7952368.1 phosphatase PAP2 family protein [Chlorobi bacterium CHB7]MDL1886485.1 phosphatase PAP2 family protein [Ignavibacteria bacterium CHB1]RIK48080.1 MAG: phosphatase PAP2 family protein [Ignavibacteriota bacterium]
MDFLNGIDVSLFYFINKSLANPACDTVMPFITEVKHWYIFYIFFILWLLIKGGARGRVLVVLLLIFVFAADQSSNYLKEILGRLRPCKTLPNVNLLVGCAGSFSLPSNHAVNNFGVAFLISAFFSKFRGVAYSVALLIGLSRVFVGVHYPFDILVGAFYGVILAYIILYLFRLINRKVKFV